MRTWFESRVGDQGLRKGRVVVEKQKESGYLATSVRTTESQAKVGH